MYSIWRGKISLAGKVTVIFERGIPPGYEPDLVGATFFEPDKQSRKKLPEAIGHFYPLPATMIWLNKSGAATLQHVVGNAEAQALVKGTQGRFEFPARVTIREFRTDVECDHRSYSAEVLAIERVEAKLVALSDGGEHGC